MDGSSETDLQDLTFLACKKCNTILYCDRFIKQKQISKKFYYLLNPEKNQQHDHFYFETEPDVSEKLSWMRMNKQKEVFKIHKNQKLMRSKRLLVKADDLKDKSFIA